MTTGMGRNEAFWADAEGLLRRYHDLRQAGEPARESDFIEAILRISTDPEYAMPAGEQTRRLLGGLKGEQEFEGLWLPQFLDEAGISLVYGGENHPAAVLHRSTFRGEVRASKSWPDFEIRPTRANAGSSWLDVKTPTNKETGNFTVNTDTLSLYERFEAQGMNLRLTSNEGLACYKPSQVRELGTDKGNFWCLPISNHGVQQCADFMYLAGV